MDVAEGRGLGSEAMFRAPLYPWTLGVIYTAGPDNRFFLVELFQHLLGAIACVFMYIAGREVFGRRAGIAAGIIAALYGPLIYYEGEILAETLFIFLAAGAIAMFVYGAVRGMGLPILAGGFFLGMSVITRPNILPFVPVAVIWAYFAGRGIGVGKRFAWAAAVAIPVALILGAMGARNYALSGRLVVVSSQGGSNFYLGNNPEADGMPPPTRMTYGATVKYRDGVEVASANIVAPAGEASSNPAARSAAVADASDIMYRAAWSYIAANPGAWFKLVVRKTALFWNDYEIRNGKSYYFQKRYSSLLRFLPMTFGMVAVLGIVGMIFGYERGKALPWILMALYCAVFAGTVIMFFVCDRLRLPIVVTLIPAAGAGVDRIISAVSARRHLIPAMSAAGIALGILVFPDWHGLRSYNFTQEHWLAGKRYYEAGECDKALSSFELSAAGDASFPGNNLYMGNCFVQKRDYVRARSCYEKTLELDPGNPRALNGLGVCAEKTGDDDAAMRFYIEATSNPAPGYAKPFVNLANILMRRNRTEEGGKLLEIALSIDSNDPETWLGLAVMSKLAGDEASAETRISTAVRLGGAEYMKYFHAAIVPHKENR